MAFLGLSVPYDTAKLLESIDVPGEKISPSDMHVTILHLGDIRISEVARAMESSYRVASKWSPFLAVCKSVDSFPANPEYGIPVIAPVVSPKLFRLHSLLRRLFDANGISYSRKHPEFRPHVTLSKNKSHDAKPIRFGFPKPCAWFVNELIIWGGHESDRSVNIHMPFPLIPD